MEEVEDLNLGIFIKFLSPHTVGPILVADDSEPMQTTSASSLQPSDTVMVTRKCLDFSAHILYYKF